MKIQGAKRRMRVLGARTWLEALKRSATLCDEDGVRLALLEEDLDWLLQDLETVIEERDAAKRSLAQRIEREIQ